MKKVFIWCSGIDGVLDGGSSIAGIQVQMSFWALIFKEKGWDVYTFTDKHVKPDVYGIQYIYNKTPSLVITLRLQLLYDIFCCVRYLILIRPNLIIYRGSSRNLFFLNVVSRWIHAKMVLFGASDLNFQIGKEAERGAAYNTKLFRRGVRMSKYIVTQNKIQHDTLYENYKKDSLIISNIWPLKLTNTLSFNKKYDVIWVSNLKRLKRPEWVLRFAERNPLLRVALVGGGVNDSFNNSIREKAKKTKNISFLGPKPFKEVTDLISLSRILLCTSTSEGFPNTFLQAWSCNVPIISTVNPSNVITENNLGFFITNEKELDDLVHLLLKDKKVYENIKTNIASYFITSHSASVGYNKLIDFIY